MKEVTVSVKLVAREDAPARLGHIAEILRNDRERRMAARQKKVA